MAPLPVDGAVHSRLRRAIMSSVFPHARKTAWFQVRARTEGQQMKVTGWLLFIGGSLLSVINSLMLIMQIVMWLTGGSSSWPPMGLSVFFGEKLNTGWAGFDMLFNARIPTVLMIIAALNGLLLAFLGMKTINNADETQ